MQGDDFFGRDTELALLTERVTDGNHVLLTGQRRMGKTSLARELGRRLERDGLVAFLCRPRRNRSSAGRRGAGRDRCCRRQSHAEAHATLDQVLTSFADVASLGGLGRALVDLLSTDEDKADGLTPLLVALRQERGEEVRTAEETLEAAADIRTSWHDRTPRHQRPGRPIP